MDYSLQAKLLRVLQEKKIRRIGGTNEINIDVRIISACNVDLIKYIEEGKFRRDLYYRIAVFPIYICPLRERKEDISYLLDIYLEKMSNKLRRKVELSNDARKVLKEYDWPGNVREIKNVIEFSSVMAAEGVINIENLPYQIGKIIKEENSDKKSLASIIKEVEINEIKKAIEYYGNSVEGKKNAAKSLGISLATLYHKIS